jgi:hypothetical protein
MREGLMRLYTLKLGFVRQYVELLILIITYQINLTLIVIITSDKYCTAPLHMCAQRLIKSYVGFFHYFHFAFLMHCNVFNI